MSKAETARGPEWLLEVSKFRELFYFLVWRDIKIRYKQTVLGASWAILEPFIKMVVFTIFFGKVANIQTDGVPKPIYYYLALVPWTYFANSVRLSGNSLLTNAKLVRKVYFPRTIIPTASALGGSLDFLIASLVVVGMMIYYGVGFTWYSLLWPVLFIPLVMFTVGLGMLFSSLNVTYRDIKYVIPFMVETMMYVSPVIWATAEIESRRNQLLMSLNPMTGIINAFRNCMLPDRPIDWTSLGIGLAVILIIFVVGLIQFRRTEKVFADLI